MNWDLSTVEGFLHILFYCVIVFATMSIWNVCLLYHVNYSQEVPLGPPDAIFKVSTGYQNDTDPRKVNLGSLFIWMIIYRSWCIPY